VFYHTLVLDQVDSQPDQELEQAGPIDIAPTLDQSFGFKNLGIGALLTIAQSWYAQGVALGQLLHSTSLAPGESTRIAMMDWTRRTKAGSTEIISEKEELDNETMHSRSLSEVTKAVANEAQEGFSSTSNTTTAHQSGKSSGSATINADPINALTGGLFGDDPGVTTGGYVGIRQHRQHGWYDLHIFFRQPFIGGIHHAKSDGPNPTACKLGAQPARLNHPGSFTRRTPEREHNRCNQL
jgi:hypothetical protein